MSSSSPILELVNIEKYYGDFQALRRVSLSVNSGSVTCIVGPSGSGKSTLLRSINGLETIDGGAVFFDGELVGEEVRNGYRVPISGAKAREQVLKFGMVFQSFNLFPNLTALHNVMLAPRTVQGLSTADARAVAMDYLTKVGLGDKTQNYPNELSGGQQQRVAIARALALEPEVMLFDEPTSALDPELVHEVLEVMRKIAARGTTMVVVTHEMNFAQEIADDLVVMADGQIIEQGKPSDVLLNPKTSRGKAFFSALTANNEKAPATQEGSLMQTEGVR